MERTETTFDLSEYADELEAAATNKNVGTCMLFENEYVRVWELKLAPGERAPFHVHSIDYFWVAADPGPVVQRTDDGVAARIVHEVGQVQFFTYRNGETKVHDLENVGDKPVRYLTIELLHDVFDTPHVHE